MSNDIAVLSGERSLSRSALADTAGRVARVLAENGVGEGDVVALLARNGFGYFVFNDAARRLGACITAINWHLKPAEVAYIIADCSPKVVVAHADLANDPMRKAFGDRPIFIEAVAPEIAQAYGLTDEQCRLRDGDVALSEAAMMVEPWPSVHPAPPPALFYTSGTTGHPKAVKRESLPLEVQAAVTERTVTAFGLADGKVTATVMTGPLYHSAPFAYATNALRLGGMVILQPRFDAEDLLRLIERHRVSHLHMVPTMFTRLLALPEEVRQRYDLSSLVAVTHGAAPCPPEVKRAMIAWLGPVVREYYAMTELGIVACSTSAQWLAHPGSVGKAAPGVSIRITDESGVELPPGTAGDICVRHAGTDAVYYHNAPEKSASLRRDSYVVTGDIGSLDAEGFLTISDRRTDMILSGGVNIYPAEIEAALLQHPSVSDAAVFGLPHVEFGEQVAAVLQLRSPVDDATLRGFLKLQLADFKVPRLFRRIDAMPREDSGKVRKRLLRDSWAAELEQAG
jgi:long-chain acyl-CoA synthetase